MLCSGKIYYDIAGHEERDAAAHIAIARVELLYPFPEEELVKLIESYPNLERVVWVQEEPRNMGAARVHAPPDGEDPPASACPTTTSAASCARPPGEGYSAAHKREQARIVRVALDLEDDRLEPDSSAQRPLM